MSFNDDDLKRLKAVRKRYEGMECVPYGVDDVDALLARLEAAEKCLAMADCDDGYAEAFNAWLRNCGKEVKP